MKPAILTLTCLALTLLCQPLQAQQAVPAAGEAEVMSDPVPPDVITSAVAAVNQLGEQVVLGRYQVTIERMNPEWKERTAARMGGVANLEKQSAAAPAEMIRNGISMLSFKTQGQPRVYQVSPARKSFVENGVTLEKFVHTKWLVFVPTVTRYRKLLEGSPRPRMIESIGYQVAISNKGKNDWTFIAGTGLTTADLRAIFFTLPQDLELPPVTVREIP